METTEASSSARATSDPQTALNVALKDFQNILTEDQRIKLGKIGIVQGADTVMIFTAQLDRENQLRKGRGIASRLYSVLQSVQAFSAVVETFVSSHPEVAALVWGSIKLTMLIAVNFTSYFETLTSIFMAFGKQCPRFAAYQALYPTSARLQRALCDFHASIIRCCKHVLEVIQRPWQQQLKKAIYQSFEQELQPDVQSIEKLGQEVKDEIALAAALAECQDQQLQTMERQAASKDRSRLRAFIPKVEVNLREMKEMHIQQSSRISKEERQRLLELLSSHDYLTPFREACKKRQCGTAEWICEVPAFLDWYKGTGPPLLWCSGKIGSGKTVLCANVINHIFLNKGCDERASFFFVDRDNADSLQAEIMLRSIIRQSIDPMAVPEHIEIKLKELHKTLFVKLGEWANLLQYIIQQSTVHFILIDGLDECSAVERRTALKELSLLSASSPHLKIFVTSRDSVSIDLRGRFPRMAHISMACDSLALDIRAYIDASIQERLRNEELVLGDPHLEMEVKDALTTHADGMFLWVVFLISEICAGSCDNDVRQSLRNLPKNLEETFTRALARILTQEKQRIELLQKVFQWVAAAKRPLTVDELSDATAIDIGQKSSTPERRVHSMNRIVLWCENLVQITEEEPKHVQFAHSSIHDFITRVHLPKGLGAFHVDLEEADHFAGEICLTYLSFSDFSTTIARRQRPVQINPMALASTALGHESSLARKSIAAAAITLTRRGVGESLDITRATANFGGTNSNGKLDKFQESYPFLEYAARYWTSHTTRFRKEKSRTWELLLPLVRDDSGLAHRPWPKIRYGSLIWSHEMQHYAVLRHAVSVLQGDKLDYLIETSVARGDTEAIAVFLETGNYSTACIDRALRNASMRGSVKLVSQLLIAKGEISGGAGRFEGQSILQAACVAGRLDVVDRLLQAKAEVNAAADVDSGRTALQVACENGHIEVVERLLRAGAEVNAAAARYRGRTALQAACENGHLVVVERLLSAEANVNAAAGFDAGRTALQAACGGGHLDVVERLINAKADIHATAGKVGGRTALQAACEGGHLEVVERLLRAKSDVNANAGWRGRTALQAACAGGYLDVVERLLSAKADVNVDTDGEPTALDLASIGGHFQLVERLLKAGARAEIDYRRSGTHS